MDVRRDVDADELQVGSHVLTFELQRRVAGNVIGGNARHLVAWRDQTVDLAVPQRAFADRVDIRIGGATGVIDDDAAALADRKTGGARGRPSRPVPISKTRAPTRSSRPGS